MKKYFIALGLGCIFFIAQLITLADYGMNWDNSSHFIRGQVYLSFFLTGKKIYEDALPFSPILIQPGEYMSRYAPAAIESAVKPVSLTPRPLPQKDLHEFLTKSGTRTSFYVSKKWDGRYFIAQQASGHPPLGDLLSALFNTVFYKWLGVMGDIESYQLVYLLISSVGVFIVSLFAYELTDSYVAMIVAGISLGLYPLFFSDTHLNVKDPAVASFFAGTVWSFWHWVREGSKKWEIFFFVFFLMALGIKWNILFLPFILLSWLVSIRKTQELKSWLNRKLFVHFFVFFLVALIFLLLLWPYSWENPVQSLLGMIVYYWQLGIGIHSIQPEGFILPFGINSYPSLLFLTQTPEIVLVFAFLAFIVPQKMSSLKGRVLLILWLCIPLLRVTLPGFRLYGGLRQIMEVLPAVAVLSGVGAASLVREISNFKPFSKPFSGEGKKGILSIGGGILVTSVLFVLLIPLIQLHPNENMYFNNFIWGVKGAYKAHLVDWTLNYGNPYRQAANWLNAHATKNANIAFLDGPMFALSPLWLRNDISISPNHFSGFSQKGEYILSLQDTLGSNIFAYRYPKRFLKPIYHISARGVPILFIYKNDAVDSLHKINEKQTTQILGSPGESNHGIYWEVNLGKIRKVTRIRLTEINRTCQKTNDPFVNELIQFLPFTDMPWSNNDVYASQEHDKISSNTIEYLFAGEDAQYIRLYPKTGLSCINDSTIESISFVE